MLSKDETMKENEDKATKGLYAIEKKKSKVQQAMEKNRNDLRKFHEGFKKEWISKEQAMGSPFSEQWLRSMREELGSLRGNGAWGGAMDTYTLSNFGFFK